MTTGTYESCHAQAVTQLLVPISTLHDAQRAIAHGADILDVGHDEDLALAVSGLGPLVCGSGDDAALTRSAAVDLDLGSGDAGRAGALAALCAWHGVAVVRTRHVLEVRRCLDMTATIMGVRPPAWAVRGLA
jgi:hypothetical protein